MRFQTVDLGASTFTNTAIRDTVIDFTVPIFEEANAVLVPRPKPASKMWNVLKPFSWRLWSYIMGSMGVATICAYTFAKFSPLSAWNLKLPWAVADEVWLQEYMWSIMGSFLQQGQDFYPYAMSSRVVLAFWWLFTFIVFGTYTGIFHNYSFFIFVSILQCRKSFQLQVISQHTLLLKSLIFL